MKEFTTDNIRNVCFVGQRGCGKTSLADAVAFNAGINSRIGRVEDGSSILDHYDNEISRKTTISSKILACEYKNKKINILDSPGHADFIGEMLGALLVADAVAVVLDAASGVEIGTQLQWRWIGDTDKAKFFFVNKLDKENVSWKNNVESIQKAFGVSAVPVQIPIGEAAAFKGVVDILKMKAYTFDDKGKAQEGPIPDDLKGEVETYREKIMEVAAETDDALMEKYFDQGSLDEKDVEKGFNNGIVSGKVFPILFGSAMKNFGVDLLLDFISVYLPSPDKFPPIKAVKTGTDQEVEVKRDPNAKTAVFVFKTVSEGHLGEMSYFKTFSGKVGSGAELVNQQTSTSERIAQVYTMQGKNRIDISSVPMGDIGIAVKLKNTHTGNTMAEKGFDVTLPMFELPNPVMDVAVRPKNRGDEEKVAAGLNKLREEDLTFRLVSDPALKQQVLYGQGSTHIEILTEKLQKRFGVDIELDKPKIPYRETIRKKAEQQYRHKKQSGGRGQYGEVYIRMEPNERGGGFEFLNEITGGAIPSKYIPAVEKGVVEQMQHGGLANAPVVDVKVTLYDGTFHDVDSSDMAFKIAASQAFKEGFLKCDPVLLEPIYNVEILTPDDFTGDVMGDLSSRRGKISGMDPEGSSQRIRAQVPQAELYQYSVDLRSMTQGRAVFEIEFSHYEEVPFDTAQKVIAEAKAQKEAEE